MRITAYVCTNKVGSDVEDELDIPDGDLADMSEEQVEEYLSSEVREWLFENIEWGWRTPGTGPA